MRQVERVPPRTDPLSLSLAPLAQGVFLAGAGAWPLVHLRSFEAVTGPKADEWLVKTIGGLLMVIGGSLIAGALERSTSKALRVLGIGSAVTIAAADAIYVRKGRISRIYLADAAAQAVLLTLWA